MAEIPEPIWQHRTRTCGFELGDDGIVRVRVLEYVDMFLSDAQENIEGVRVISGGKLRPTLVDMRQQKSITREGRVYFEEKQARVLSASALLVGSPLSRMLGNFFMGIHRSDVPTKLFTSESDALEWLCSFLSDAQDAETAGV